MTHLRSFLGFCAVSALKVVEVMASTIIRTMSGALSTIAPSEYNYITRTLDTRSNLCNDIVESGIDVEVV